MLRQEFLDHLRRMLGDKGLPHADIDDAVAYYDEAIGDRMEEGMAEREAVAAMGAPADAAEGIIDGLPPARHVWSRMLAALGGRRVLMALLVVTSFAWLPVAAGVGGLVAGVLSAFVLLGATLVLVLGAALLCGILALPVLVYAALSGVVLAGLLTSGLYLVLAGLGILAIPIVRRVVRGLSRLCDLLVRWVARLFRRVRDEEGRDLDSMSLDEGRFLNGVGLLLVVAGIAMVLVAFVASGMDPVSLPPIPPIGTPFGNLVFGPLTLQLVSA